MERLTCKGLNFIPPLTASPMELCKETERHQKYYDRLLEYEDIGFTPQEIKSRLEMYEKASKTKQELRKILNDLTNDGNSDSTETYTTGYKNGHRNGQIELIKRILKVPDGTKLEAEKALKEG